MNNTDVIRHLESFDLEEVRAHLSEAPPCPQGRPLEELIDSAIQWVDGLRGDTITLAREVVDDDDVAMAIAIQYVELKSRWIAFNTKMNYERFRKGDCDRADMCKAACATQLLAHLETLLDPADVDKITGFLAKPLKNAA